MIIIWLATLVPSTIWAQINTLFVKQGTTLNRSLSHGFQIPAASLGSFVTLSMLISVPMYDRYFVPFMRRKTGNPRGITLLQRLGVGFVIQIIAIAIAYAVEVRRMHVIRTNHIVQPKQVVPMSILWLLPQYILLGIADVFNAIGLLEFFYDQSPEHMQSLGTTFFTSGIGVGNFLNSFLVTVVDKITGENGGKSWIGNNLNDSHLDYYYGFLLVISTINLGVFLWVSSMYIYKKEAIDQVKDGIETKGLDTSPLGLQVWWELINIPIYYKRYRIISFSYNSKKYSWCFVQHSIYLPLVLRQQWCILQLLSPNKIVNILNCHYIICVISFSQNMSTNILTFTYLFSSLHVKNMYFLMFVVIFLLGQWFQMPYTCLLIY